MFRQLAVFAGGFTLEAGAAVGDHTPEKAPFDSEPDSRDSETTFLDSITSLVDKNLVHVVEGDDLRFGMLETMREYGLERLAEAGEETQVRERHAAWCLALAEFAEPELVGRDQVRWFSRLETELDNLRAALAWAIERRDAETALLMASALQRYWTTQGYGSEGRRWLEQALATDVVATPGVRAKALAVAALINYYQGDYERAAALGEDALALFRELGDQNGTALSLGTLAKVANATNDDDQAVALCEEALTLFRMLGNQRQAAVVINDLGLIAWRQGDLKRAAAFHEEALTLRRELEDRVALAQSLSNLGLVAADLGDYARAAVLEGESLELEVELGNKRGLADSFENLAMIAEATEDDEFAARLFGAAEVLRARIGVPAVPGDIDYVERHVANIRARLGEATLTAAWEAGRAMSLDEAITYALKRGWLEAAGVGLT
jgi:non-specific serine/threonine protein kinase